MNYWIKDIQKLIIGLSLISLLVSVANAEMKKHDSLEFSLELSNSDSHFNYYSNTLDTHFNHRGIKWYETFNDYFQAGLELGNVEMTQLENPLLSSQYTSGEYLGLILHLLPVDTSFFTLLFKINYRYNHTKGESTNQLTEFNWDETSLASQVFFKATNYIHLFVAADYQVFNGEQHDSGNLTKITKFKESEQNGYRFGINFKTNRSGTVGLERFTGFSRGTRLYFARKF